MRIAVAGTGMRSAVCPDARGVTGKRDVLVTMVGVPTGRGDDRSGIVPDTHYSVKTRAAKPRSGTQNTVTPDPARPHGSAIARTGGQDHARTHPWTARISSANRRASASRAMLRLRTMSLRFLHPPARRCAACRSDVPIIFPVGRPSAYSLRREPVVECARFSAADSLLRGSCRRPWPTFGTAPRRVLQCTPGCQRINDQIKLPCSSHDTLRLFQDLGACKIKWNDFIQEGI